MTSAGDNDQGIPEAGAELLLLERLRLFAAGRRLVPPLTLPQLYAEADRFLETATAAPEYRDWLVVMLSNCLWEETVAAVPCDKRVLLLPECLKNSGRCQAEHDEFGLLCRCCGGCDIGRLIDEAEARGMMTLVAEGSTMVADLIKSGDVEAVVGVSCLEALEKAFPSMTSAAIPGLAIPLRKSGCRDTRVNQELLRQAVALPWSRMPSRLPDPQLKSTVEAWFAPATLAQIMGPANSAVEQLGQEWLSGDGKRWRPFLTAAVFAAATGVRGGDHPRDVQRLAVAAECFHKASLVHDDIEDNDLERYGKETLHARIGVAQALNIGDFLVGEGYRMIAETELAAEAKMALLREAASAHRQLTLGQGMELAWRDQPGRLAPDQVLECFRLKTAPAFRAALAFGAIAAGIHGQIDGLIQDYSDALGIAYQIADDLEDFSADTLGGSPSIVLAHLHQACPECRPEELREKVRRGELEAETARAREASKQLLAQCRDRAYAALAPLERQELKMLFFRVAGRILK